MLWMVRRLSSPHHPPGPDDIPQQRGQLRAGSRRWQLHLHLRAVALADGQAHLALAGVILQHAEQRPQPFVVTVRVVGLFQHDAQRLWPAPPLPCLPPVAAFARAVSPFPLAVAPAPVRYGYDSGVEGLIAEERRLLHGDLEAVVARLHPPV